MVVINIYCCFIISEKAWKGKLQHRNDLASEYLEGKLLKFLVKIPIGTQHEFNLNKMMEQGAREDNEQAALIQHYWDKKIFIREKNKNKMNQC